MDFLFWWFEEHWVLSTIFTPFMVIVWCFWTPEWEFFRVLIAFVIWLIHKAIA